MSEHTLGPWVYGFAGGTILIFDAKGGPTIAGIPYSDEKDLPLAENNARLIAAAPELLDALKLCYDHCRLYYPEVEHNNVGESVRAAIAKAEGDQQ
jgi:hypothetical protein